MGTNLITVFSDLHIHNYKKYDEKGSRLKNTLKILRDIFEFNHKKGIKFTLFGGDLYDQQKNIPTVVVNETIKTLAELFNEFPDQKIIAISGNHDQASKNILNQKSETALTHLTEVFPREFILIDDSVHSIKDQDVNIFGIPYYEYKEHFQEQLVSANCELEEGGYKKSYNILMIHQTPKHSNPFIPYDVLPDDELFESFDLVLCGHIHGYEKLTEKFYLIGSPLHRDLGDEGLEKGFLVLDLDLPTFGPERVLTQGYPKFIKSKVVDPDSTDFVVPIIEIENTQDDDFEVEKFTVNNKKSDLVQSYWENVDGKNSRRLELGLKFIQGL